MSAAERGRPRLDAEERKDATLRVRLRPEDLDRIKAAAQKAEKSPSQWARDVLLRSLSTTR